MENGLIKIDYSSSEVIRTLKATVAIGATDAEFAMFIEQCKATGLNPFKKEVWFIKAGGRVQIMTGIQGFFAIANSAPEFDGHESGLITPSGEMVSAAYPKQDFIGAWCKVYRKDRRMPSEAIAMLSEYDKGQGTWKVMRRVMIIKCAESVALRKAFPQQLNGLYTAEEMPSEYTGPLTSETAIESNSGPTVIDSVTTADDMPKPEHDPSELLGFGKFRDMTWGEVNTKYLEWCAQQTGKNAKRAIAELERRANEKPQGDLFESDDLPEEWGTNI